MVFITIKPRSWPKKIWYHKDKKNRSIPLTFVGHALSWELNDRTHSLPFTQHLFDFPLLWIPKKSWILDSRQYTYIVPSSGFAEISGYDKLSETDSRDIHTFHLFKALFLISEIPSIRVEISSTLKTCNMSDFDLGPDCLSAIFKKGKSFSAGLPFFAIL